MLFVNVRHMTFYFQSSKEATEDKQVDRSECKLNPVRPGGTILSNFWGICPLFSCAPSLLEGPLVENEGLWYQHPYYVGQYLQLMCLVQLTG